MAKVDKHVLENGMVVLAEPIEQIESAAFSILLPCGASRLEEGACGAGSVICDWIFRGAGEYSSMELVDKLDGLGLHRSSNVTSSHLYLGCSMEAGSMAEALTLYGDVIFRPRLEAEQFELSQLLALAELEGLEDDPRQKVMLELRERFYPDPLGRPPMGRKDELEKLTPQRTADIIKQNFNPAGAILATAGKYDFDEVCKTAEKVFGSHKATQQQEVAAGNVSFGYDHIDRDGSQVHIGLMTPSVPPGSEDYYNTLVAVNILSGSMSSRLFTEVREKRGLCYAVHASYHSLKQSAGVSCYAGTTPDKAQETYDVTLKQFKELAKNITEDELNIAKVGLKSSVIMQGESSSARTSAIARDHYLLGYVRSLDEIEQAVDAVSIGSVKACLEANPFEDYKVVTIGAKQIKV